MDLVGEKITIGMLAERLSQIVGRTVFNRTGLSGDFDFAFEFAAVEEPAPQSGADAIAKMGPVDVLVIDHVEDITSAAKRALYENPRSIFSRYRASSCRPPRAAGRHRYRRFLRSGLC